jgi:DNA-binding XRE family transcriptional regulator
MQAQRKVQPSSEVKAKSLSKAVVRAAEILDLPQAQLAQILGLSPATVSRMRSGQYVLDPERKEWELAAMFVRVFRSLDSITGGDDTACRVWLRSENTELPAQPLAMLSEVKGLVHLADYLDSYRARV